MISHHEFRTFNLWKFPCECYDAFLGAALSLGVRETNRVDSDIKNQSSNEHLKVKSYTNCEPL